MAEPIFTRKYELRVFDFDTNKRIKPSCIMDILQDVAGEQAKQLGVDADTIITQNLLWVILREKLELRAEMFPHQVVTVKTWYSQKPTVLAKREFEITDEQGNILAVASSHWALIDSNTRALTGMKSVAEKFSAPLSKAHIAMKPLHEFDTADTVFVYHTGYSDLDTNGHVNNTRYADFVLNAIGDKKVKSLQIDFRKEIMADSDVSAAFTQKENVTLIKGICGGELMFLASVEEE